MSKPIALLGHFHLCPEVEPGPVPHVGGPIIEGSDFVTVNGIPVAVKGDNSICLGCGQMDAINSGSDFFTIDGKEVAMLSDTTEHAGIIIQGESLVLIG